MGKNRKGAANLNQKGLAVTGLTSDTLADDTQHVVDLEAGRKRNKPQNG
ncbi:MAG: hypothetical protein ACM32O_18735 [Clostridia bacterium]